MTMRRTLAMAFLGLAVVAGGGATRPLAAQEPRRITLKPADATHDEEFSVVSSVRELRDGRLLVSDGREQKLVVLDFAAGTSTAVGAKGRGPGEYSMVSWLHPIGSDSTMMWDLLVRRWLVFDGARIVTTVPPDDPTLMAMQSLLQGADSRGRVMARIDPKRSGGVTVTGKEDSAFIVFGRRGSGRLDTVARARNVSRQIEINYKADGTIGSSSFRQLGIMPSDEQAILFEDGWLAVTRLEPFRVDWRSPTGAWTRGAPLPVRAIPFDAAEKAAYQERRLRNIAAQGPRPAGLPPAPPPPTDFPDFVPPYQSGIASQQGPSGVLIIKRAPSRAVTGNSYFVVDRAGKLVGEIVLPAERAIVGSGPRAIYTTLKDADDLQRIERHPWP